MPIGAPSCLTAQDPNFTVALIQGNLRSTKRRVGKKQGDKFRCKTQPLKRGGKMIKVSVFYPSTPGGKFDMNYYCTKHLTLVQQRLGAACKGVAIEHGISGGAPEILPEYIAMGHVYFDSMDAFAESWGRHIEEFLADVPNYTDIQPVIQVSEVKV
jgi:uncharacterized protein (TIGR02118 family)